MHAVTAGWCAPRGGGGIAALGLGAGVGIGAGVGFGVGAGVDTGAGLGVGPALSSQQQAHHQLWWHARE